MSSSFCPLCLCSIGEGGIPQRCTCNRQVHERCLRESVVRLGRPICPACDTRIPLAYDRAGIFPYIAFGTTLFLDWQMCSVMGKVALVLWNYALAWIGFPTEWSALLLLLVATALLAIFTVFRTLLNPVTGFGLEVAVGARRRGGSGFWTGVVATMVVVAGLYATALVVAWPSFFFYFLGQARMAYEREMLKRAPFL